MARGRSWWRTKQIRHRDAVIVSVVSSACLLAGEVANQDIVRIYEAYLAPNLGSPGLLILYAALSVLAFTNYFGGIFVLLGGLHFSWGRTDRGRFLVGLGIGVSVLGLASRLARATLATGTPLGEILQLTTPLTGAGILFGLGAHVLMGEYALMLKKHARSAWRRWRRTRRPLRRSTRS